MDFRLRAFLAVADNLSFTKASKELGVSQPAVTKHVQELENRYKVKLFSRQGTGIVMTQEGAALKKYAQEIVSGYDRMNMEMELLKNPAYGALRLGIDTATAQNLYRKVLPLFEERLHNVHLTVLVSGRKKLEESLQNGELDLVAVDDSGTLSFFPQDGLSPQAEAFVKFVKIYL